MTVLLVLGGWLLLSLLTCVLFGALVRGGRTLMAERERVLEVVLPTQRAEQGIRSTATTGGRG